MEKSVADLKSVGRKAARHQGKLDAGAGQHPHLTSTQL